VVLRRNSNALFLLQRVRDEAHRFAITYHRKLRHRERLRSALDAIPGVGPTRRRVLLRHFGSVRRICAASVDELAQVPGISAALAAQIKGGLAALTAMDGPERTFPPDAAQPQPPPPADADPTPPPAED
jgi:excinuclease ABC subunit C